MQQNIAATSINDTSAYMTQSRALTNQYAGLPTLQRNIMEFLVGHPPSEDGVHVGAIARAVHCGDAAQIRSDGSPLSWILLTLPIIQRSPRCTDG